MKKKLFCILSVIAILITSTVPVMAAMTSEGTSAEVGDYLVSYNAENYTVSVDGHSYVLDDVLKNRIQKGYSYSIICQSTFAFGYDLRFYIFTYSSSYSLGCWESGNYFFFLLDSSRNFITDSSLNPDAYLTEIIYTPSSASFKSVDSVFPYYPHSSSSSSYSDERFCKLISDPFCFFTTDNIYNVYVYSGGIGDSKYHLSVEDSYFFSRLRTV